MSPKAKKGLILTGIISGAIIAPIAFATVPYGIQQGILQKQNNRLITTYNQRSEEYKAKTADTEKEIKEKEAKRQEIKAKLDKETREEEKKKLSD
ncbi:hypothetical protein [Metamycoplasma auris]|uniref:Uncharacterized protein n=1 Tax=Metamycoplasma auris TaxID=51363 RepID=A0A2W7GRG4_9BACT|nr:hypothetical protein [Metamycoplasma auris]PZV99848.1 hypothetical protein BCF89_1065 [Metamycoplasma auris]